MRQTRSKYLSLRLTPKMFEILQAEAADAGMTTSSFVREHLVRVLKERRYRRHLLGQDQPRAPHSHIGNQCSTPPA